MIAKKAALSHGLRERSASGGESDLMMRIPILLLSVLLVVFALTARAQTTYGQWLAAGGLPPDATGDGALLAAPAGDGVANLVKFGLGLDPGVSGYGGRYSVETIAGGEGDYLAVRYERPGVMPAGIAYDVEMGSNLAGWTAGGVEVGNSTVGDMRIHTVRDVLPTGSSGQHRFMRLKISVTAQVPANVAAPQITGLAQVGQMLSASAGGWEGGPDAVVSVFQWTRNGVDIPGATSASYQPVEADAGATVSVRVTGRNIAGAASVVAAGVGPVNVATAFPAMEIRPDGYTADLSVAGLATGGTYDLSPDASPKVVLTVVSPGFDANGAATTVTREILGTVALRQPYPNENLHTEAAIAGGVKVTIALSDRIYAGDTITHCTLLAGAYTASGVPSPAASLTSSGGRLTNVSALAYPKAIANWLAFPRERAVAGTTSFDLELLAFHRHPRDGRQVACVEFIATDEHGHSASVKTSDMVRSTRVTTGNPIAVYRGSIPLGALTQGDHITVRTKVYPFVGDSSGVLDSDPSADGAPAEVPSGFANHTFLNDKTGGYGTVYAYVSPAGNDSTGTASEVGSTASASPFLTIYAAASAVKAKNNALYGHNDLGGGVVRLMAGTYAGFGAGSLNALGAGKTWLTIESAPGEGVSTVSIEPGTKKNPGNWVMFRNLSLAPTAASHTVLDAVDDGNADGPPTIYGAYEGVRIHGLSGAAPIIYRVGLRHFIGCDMKDLGRSLSAPYSTNREHTPLLAGCTLSHSTQVASGGLALPTWTNVGNVVSKGFYFTEVTSTAGSVAGTTRVVAPKFGILAFNSEYGAVTTNSFGFKQPVGGGGGLAIVQNVFEFITNTSSPCFNLAADSAVMAMDNVVVQHMTVVGARTNFLYNDDGTTALATTGSKRVDKNGTFLYSMLNQYNCKTDTFVKPGEGPDGARTGNWEPHHGVGQAGNVYEHPAANGPTAPYTGPNSWNGMFLGRGVKVAGTAGFVNDLSLGGANTGGGNYRIGASSDARNRVPSGMATLPFDLDGNARRNDGTGAAGAYEY
jgi:hypothetical protein